MPWLTCGRSFVPAVSVLLLVSAALAAAPAADDSVSHRPMRPLPAASSRALPDGPLFFVDAKRGDDDGDGSRENPWRTVSHAVRRLKPGDTLCLRGGTYYEHVDLAASGEEGRPITLRSFPGELAVIDGGLREFYDEPETAWEPCEGGAEHEYVSVRSWPEFAGRPIVNAFVPSGWEPFHGIEEQRPVVQGQFGDSLVPLHGYRNLADLRDDSMLWDVGQKFDTQEGVYCGPGLWYNRDTGRIHIRLAHTTLEGLGEDAYRGVTDPRRVPLIVSGAYGEDVLRMKGIRHLVVQDLVLRGASGNPLINICGAEDITLDGITVYGGSPGLLVNATGNLRIVNCAFRGLAAPWSSRASMKYRGTPSYVIITQRNQPLNHDFEFAWNEFTDGHDFAWVRDVQGLRFHHNFVENFNDDGLEVGAKWRNQELFAYQNLLARCLLTFTLHEIEPDESPPEVEPSSGVFITRNVVDLRRGVFKAPPRVPDPSGGFLNEPGVLCSDHGGPVWPHYCFYHNTVVRANDAWRGYYGFGMGGQGVRNTKRRVLNNIFVQLRGLPGLNFQPEPADVFVDGNLHWGVADGPAYAGEFFEDRKRASTFRGKPYPEGWMAHDLFVDPRFAKLTHDVSETFDLTLLDGSPAIDAGVPVPPEWFDPVRDEDGDRPDIGAVPFRGEPWQVGVHGRMSMFGEPGAREPVQP